MSEATKPEYETPFATGPTVQLLVWKLCRDDRGMEDSCPRLAVWEDALADDLVRIDRGVVFLTAVGRERLR
jgi:hypothetical protein